MKFICDAMLGKLAKNLRILGLDAEYIKNTSSLQHYQGHTDPPYFLTRTSGKMHYTMHYKRIIFIKSDSVKDQLREIKEIILPYIDQRKVMNRCIECNAELVEVEKINVEQKVPEFVYHQYGQFRECPKCEKVYWEGSHTAGMVQLVREMIVPTDGKNTKPGNRQ
jgi:uncharacterized protein with PIN domain